MIFIYYWLYAVQCSVVLCFGLYKLAESHTMQLFCNKLYAIFMVFIFVSVQCLLHVFNGHLALALFHFYTKCGSPNTIVYLELSFLAFVWFGSFWFGSVRFHFVWIGSCLPLSLYVRIGIVSHCQWHFRENLMKYKY